MNCLTALVLLFLIIIPVSDHCSLSESIFMYVLVKWIPCLKDSLDSFTNSLVRFPKCTQTFSVRLLRAKCYPWLTLVWPQCSGGGNYSTPNSVTNVLKIWIEMRFWAISLFLSLAANDILKIIIISSAKPRSSREAGLNEPRSGQISLTSSQHDNDTVSCPRDDSLGGWVMTNAPISITQRISPNLPDKRG